MEEQRCMNLSEEQRLAVEVETENLIVLANPGSGKTQVLAARVAHFVLAKIVPLGGILVVSFSNAAVNELRSRLAKYSWLDVDRLRISTFHDECCRILRTNCGAVGLGRNFGIADSHDR